MKKARVILIFIGVISVIFSLLGFLYNFISLINVVPHKQETPYFYSAYYTMSAICIACFIVLLLCGVQFIRLRSGIFPLFAGILIFEVVYIFSIGVTWLIPKVGLNIAAATGVANGGLTCQLLVLFPLWAPFLAGWASNKISKSV